MSGVTVIRYLLANNAPVLAVVPATKIMAGDVPIKTVLPQISVAQISGVERLTVGMNGSKRMHTDRVQVSVLAKGTSSASGYDTQKSLLALVRTACANQNGTINGVDLDSILPDIVGPDLYDPDTLVYQQSQDFVVKYRI